jgi:hypothetical protein
VAHYILNTVREDAAELLRSGQWPVGAGERHRDALAAGDLVLAYAAAPRRELVGRAALAAVDDSGVRLVDVEEWDPPLSMHVVLSRLGPSARADFDDGVVLITEHEYETALAVAAEQGSR